MKKPTVERLIKVMGKKGYEVYDTPSVDWNLNIVGIRAKSRIPEEFDDLLVVFHRFLGTWDVAYYPITTDPSPYYLENPIKEEGTAVLAPNQYRASYKIDTHRKGKKSEHMALCQRLGDVDVYRDDNKDRTLNMDKSTMESGRFGINVHKGPRGGEWENKNTHYSAGCQVFADDRHFDEFMLKCEYGKEAFGNSFTYTLLLERDL